MNLSRVEIRVDYGLTVDRMLSEAVRVEWVGAECDHGKEPVEQMRLFDDERR